MEIFTIIAFALLNRARGSKLYGLTDSTTIGRLISTMGMALTTSLWFMGDAEKMAYVFFWVWASLMLWCVPAWDEYWSAEIGQGPKSRLWGLGMMSLRMTLAVPCIVGLALFITGGNPLYALMTPLLGLPYFIFGYLTPGTYTIRNSELAVGAMLGILIRMAI